MKKVVALAALVFGAVSGTHAVIIAILATLALSLAVGTIVLMTGDSATSHGGRLRRGERSRVGVAHHVP
jgi:hypothetical protein